MVYSAKASLILTGMVLTGAARTVTAKLFFQLGFDHPLFLTLLYLTGQALSLIPYNILVMLNRHDYQLLWEDNSLFPRLSKEPAKEVDDGKDEEEPKQVTVYRSQSVHGLPQQSKTEKHHSKIPWYLKPAIPAFFNLLNSAMRWASLVFVAASVAEMLISGMELVLSVCATRLIRGRKVTWVRWLGVLIVTAGIILVGAFDTKSVAQEAAAEDEDGSEGGTATVNGQIIGISLILGQSFMSVVQDLTEEVFMQEAEFNPVLLVGMEGAYGIIIALILYFPIAPLLGENPSDVMDSFQSDGKVIGLAIGWTLLVSVTGIYNIAATAVTSSMTRNVWKNMRTLLVWIMGLVIFYATGNSDLGESFDIPGSLLILLGYAVMCAGIFVYYGRGARAS